MFPHLRLNFNKSLAALRPAEMLAASVALLRKEKKSALLGSHRSSSLGIIQFRQVDELRQSIRFGR